MFTKTNRQDVLIGKDITKAALSSTPNPTDTAVQDGEILVLGYNIANNKEEVITTAVGATIGKYPRIRLVQKVSTGTAAEYIYSSWINGRYVSAYNGKSYAAGQEQIHVIGYNGTSGSIDTTADTEFTTRIQYKMEKEIWAEQVHLRPYVFTQATPVQADIASDLMKQINNDPATMVSAEMLSAHAGTAIGAAADTIVGSAGSTQLVCTDTGADSSLTALTAGDFIRVGTATTAAIYKIASGSSLAVTGGTVTLESPLQSAVNLVGNTCEYITAAQAAASAAGVKLTGLALPWTLDTFPYTKTAFTIGLEGWGTTTLTKTQEAKKGTGDYRLVAEHEWQAKQDRGALNTNRWPFPGVYGSPYISYSSASTYDLVYIAHLNGQPDTIEGIRLEPQQIYLYMVVDAVQWATGNTNNDDIKTILDTWMASVPGAFPAVVI